MNDSVTVNKILWGKALWKSTLALLISFVFYLLPGLIVGIKMGAELGPNSNNPAEVSATISKAVSILYQENTWINIGFIVLNGLLLFLYSKKLSKGTGDKMRINGLIVGSFPALIGLLSIIMIGSNIFFLAMIIVSLGSGLLGSVVHTKSS